MTIFTNGLNFCFDIQCTTPIPSHCYHCFIRKTSKTVDHKTKWRKPDLNTQKWVQMDHNCWILHEIKRLSTEYNPAREIRLKVARSVHYSHFSCEWEDIQNAHQLQHDVSASNTGPSSLIYKHTERERQCPEDKELSRERGENTRMQTCGVTFN